MTNELKFRLEKIERANEMIRKAKDKASVIAINFEKDKDYESFLSATITEAKNLKNEYHTEFPSIAVYITDALVSNWQEGNQIIVTKAREQRIIPASNVFGERLEAMDCLSQLIQLNSQEP